MIQSNRLVNGKVVAYTEEQIKNIETEEIKRLKTVLIDSVSIVRKTVLKEEFIVDGRRQDSKQDDRDAMLDCANSFELEEFLTDETQWGGEPVPTVHWRSYEVKGDVSTMVVTKFTDAKGLLRMRSLWMLRNEKARAFEQVIIDEIKAKRSITTLQTYDVLKRFKELLGEV